MLWMSSAFCKGEEGEKNAASASQIIGSHFTFVYMFKKLSLWGRQQTGDLYSVTTKSLFFFFFFIKGSM